MSNSSELEYLKGRVKLMKHFIVEGCEDKTPAMETLVNMTEWSVSVLEGQIAETNDLTFMIQARDTIDVAEQLIDDIKERYL